MSNNARVIGMMIRKYRLEQNMSQEALCQGICAVSYLSKIEKGTVLCSDEILSRLFDILGISIPDDSQCLEIYREKINDYFRYFFLSNYEETGAIMKELDSQKDILRHSYLCIDMMLVEAYHSFNTSNDNAKLRSQLLDLLQHEDYMDNLQSHHLYMILGMFETFKNGDYPSALGYYQLAQNRMADGLVLEALATVHYLLGDYLESITLGDEAYRRLMEEGYVELATRLCSVIAASYANLKNTKKMLEYYNRILALNSGSKNKFQTAMIYYNIGSCYLAAKDYIKALHNLDKSYEMAKDYKEDVNSYVMLLQKLVLTHMGLDQRDEAKVYLNLALDFYKDLPEKKINESLRISLDWMRIMCTNENYLQDEDYLDSARLLYEASLKDSHHGFQRFYATFLIDAYKAQRKYKEALKITESIYVKG